MQLRSTYRIERMGDSNILNQILFQALFHAKTFANATDHQKYCNMDDLEGFIGENVILEMKDKVVV